MAVHILRGKYVCPVDQAWRFLTKKQDISESCEHARYYACDNNGHSSASVDVDVSTSELQ